jgi:hypothetical protein
MMNMYDANASPITTNKEQINALSLFCFILFRFK